MRAVVTEFVGAEGAHRIFGQSEIWIQVFGKYVAKNKGGGSFPKEEHARLHGRIAPFSKSALRYECFLSTSSLNFERD